MPYDYEKAKANWKRKQDKAVVVASLNSAKSNSRSELNRSEVWDYATTYPEARSISPFPLMPIR